MIATHDTKYGRLSFFDTDLYMGKNLAGGGDWDEELSFICSFLKPSWNVIQAGGNIGLFPIVMSRFVTLVTTFEPQKKVYELLQRNLHDNQIPNVNARCSALGATSGWILCPLMDHEKEGDFCGVGLQRMPDEGVVVERAEAVPMETIDSVVRGHVHFIQLDLEGMEFEALEGAKDTIARCRPIVYFEDNRPNDDFPEFVLAHDYRTYYVMGQNILCIPNRRDYLCPA